MYFIYKILFKDRGLPSFSSADQAHARSSPDGMRKNFWPAKSPPLPPLAKPMPDLP